MNRVVEKRAEKNAAAIVGIIYICAWCQRVKVPEMAADLKEAWKDKTAHCCDHHSNVSHGICPDCREKMMRSKSN